MWWTPYPGVGGSEARKKQFVAKRGVGVCRIGLRFPASSIKFVFLLILWVGGWVGGWAGRLRLARAPNDPTPSPEGH